MDPSRAYAHLERAILIGELRPRERLVESDLAEQLGLSRTPVREALRRLEERGLVRILPRRGAVVADLSPAEVESIYEIRVCLETLAIRLALAAITPRQIARVSELETYCSRLLSSGDVITLMAANDRFHDAIYEASGNPCLLEMIRQLRQRVSLIRFTAWSLPKQIGRSMAEHRQFVELLRTRKTTRMASLIRRHLRAAKEAYLLHASPGVRGRGGRKRAFAAQPC
ncbi:MAG: GntR family transcriptional regulator [candidate division NC10 bacterium]|nr:GntR family transcriptional regulator [candidate division NC10 bacterium]